MAERSAGIVLAGGRSRRMGTPKATLEWHGSTLLRRAVGIVGRAVDGPVVVVHAPGQALPPLPAQIELAEDAREGRGPLQGIASGLAAIGDHATIVFVSGVDAPLLHPCFIRHVLRSLGPNDDVALPHARGSPQPLAAAYRTTIAPLLDELLAQDRLATRDLFAQLCVREIDEAALLADRVLKSYDRMLDSLLNINDPDEYQAARARQPPPVCVQTPEHPELRAVNAATLAAAAAAAGTPLRRAMIAQRRGVADDPQEPLVPGDTLNFLGDSFDS
jgi:molybdopterin-guanine dinucleotide biosynthesis protein A